jgi:hypothetical protein
MLDEADVVVYNKTAEQTDDRVNRGDRIINNRYSDLDYHKRTLELINESKKQSGDKEYIELDEKDYLANHILVEPDAIPHKKRESQQRDVINAFLNEFGITVNHLDNYDN